MLRSTHSALYIALLMHAVKKYLLQNFSAKIILYDVIGSATVSLVIWYHSSFVYELYYY